VKKTGENMRGDWIEARKTFFDPFLGFSSKALLFPRIYIFLDLKSLNLNLLSITVNNLE
jgi:hypothetical protein